MIKMSTVPVPRKLPVVLSRQEVTRLVDAAGNPKYRAALSVAYGAGLRTSEVVALKISDIDNTRMTLRVEQGKGHKDRYAMLSPVLLEHLRTWWHFAHIQGLMLEGGWLFPGQNPVNHLTARQLASSIVPVTLPPVMPRLINGFRCTPCVTALPHTCWKPKWIYESSRYCWGTKNWKRRHFMRRSPRIFYAR